MLSWVLFGVVAPLLVLVFAGDVLEFSPGDSSPLLTRESAFAAGFSFMLFLLISASLFHYCVDRLRFLSVVTLLACGVAHTAVFSISYTQRLPEGVNMHPLAPAVVPNFGNCRFYSHVSCCICARVSQFLCR